jgi:hypothetical protein
MARFHITIESSDLVISDPAGLELADAEAACREAINGGAEIVADELKRGAKSVDVNLHIDDHHGARIKTVRISAFVNLE